VANITARIDTDRGPINLTLFADQAPLTVANFVNLARRGYYDGLNFHRVIADFMIQGGGFTADGDLKPTRPGIQNEADNGLRNVVGSIAMARTGDPHSATCQFFINLKHNTFLDHGVRDFGYAVFGKVTKGMDVVDKIAAVQTGAKGPFPRDCPKEDVVIQSIRVK